MVRQRYASIPAGSGADLLCDQFFNLALRHHRPIRAAWLKKALSRHTFGRTITPYLVPSEPVAGHATNLCHPNFHLFSGILQHGGSKKSSAPAPTRPQPTVTALGKKLTGVMLVYRCARWLLSQASIGLWPRETTREIRIRSAMSRPAFNVLCRRYIHGCSGRR